MILGESSVLKFHPLISSRTLYTHRIVNSSIGNKVKKRGECAWIDAKQIKGVKSKRERIGIKGEKGRLRAIKVSEEGGKEKKKK